MNVLGWVAVAAVGWLASSIGVALVVARVIHRRDEQKPTMTVDRHLCVVRDVRRVS